MKDWIRTHYGSLLSILIALHATIMIGIVKHDWNQAIAIITPALLGSVVRSRPIKGFTDLVTSHASSAGAGFAIAFAFLHSLNTGDWTTVVEALTAGVLPASTRVVSTDKTEVKIGEILSGEVAPYKPSIASGIEVVMPEAPVEPLNRIN